MWAQSLLPSSDDVAFTVAFAWEPQYITYERFVSNKFHTDDDHPFEAL